MNDDLDAISRHTLAHYNDNADSFFAGTIDHDVSQNIDALLGAITTAAPATILDLGCGPGRDLKQFTLRGHHAIGVDGSAQFVRMARAFSGCEVWQQDFMHLTLPAATFDGIFANASLFHVPSRVLPAVLAQLVASLKAGGVLLSSNPRGNNEEGWQGARYGTYHDLAQWRAFAEAAGLTYVDHYYRPPGQILAEQRWLASLWRNSGAPVASAEPVLSPASVK